jgi:3-isopropylmalate/(R)-2-methylmalate dehydratase large subunit
MDRPASLFDRLWAAHRVAALPTGVDLVAIDRLFLHERTGAAALSALEARGLAPADPARVAVTFDHIVDTTPGRHEGATRVPGGEAFLKETRAACERAGLRLFGLDSPDQGIVHVAMPELGLALPGMTIVCPDSHTCTQGALGSLAWGIGSTEATHALATMTLRMARPPSMRVRLDGRLAEGVTAKDLALAVIARFGSAGGQGHAVEYAGSAVRAMSMEARFTLANMATEFAAAAACIGVDEVTLDWVRGRRFAPAGAAWDAAEAAWRALASHPDAAFDRELSLDASTVAPMVSWGTTPAESVAIDGTVPVGARRRALDYMRLSEGQPLAGLPVNAAFIGSCTNARLEDLRAAAAVLEGRHVAPGVQAIIVPGSSAVKRAAEAEGLDRIFLNAGFECRESGCSLCFFAGGEHLGEGARVISSTNRNFEGRQGPGTRTHIASPATVAASALAGVISDPRPLLAGRQRLAA